MEWSADLPAPDVLWTNPISMLEMEGDDSDTSAPAAAYELHEITVLSHDDDVGILTEAAEPVDEHPVAH